MVSIRKMGKARMKSIVMTWNGRGSVRIGCIDP